MVSFNIISEIPNAKSDGNEMKGMNRKKRKISSFIAIAATLTLFLVPFQTILANDQINLSFDPRFNEPPSKPINVYPPNGSINIRIPVTLKVCGYDESTSRVTVYFYNASNDALVGINYNVDVSGIGNYANVTWNGLQKNITYSWYAIVSDSEYQNRSDTWSFTTKPNGPPSIENEFPTNDSIDVGVRVTTQVQVGDEDDDLVYIYWYENSTGNWTLRQNSSGYNGTYYWNYSQASDYLTTYYWTVAVNDSVFNISSVFHFTTVANQPPAISDPTPENNSLNVSKATFYWKVIMTDLEGDNFNWTIETSPFIGNASAYNDTNGEKSCPLSGLQYNTTYKVYVNATDTGSGRWRYSTFYFRTAGPGVPTISNEYPRNRSTNIGLQPTCHVDVQDLGGEKLTVYWYEKNTTGAWVLSRTDVNISSNTTVYWVFSSAISYLTTYDWKVKVDNGYYSSTATYWFTTSETPSTPPPQQPPVSPPNYTIVPPMQNQHPIAIITGPSSAYTNETLVFYARYSYDPDGNITGYQWDFNNDGVFDTDWIKDKLIAHSYSHPGNYTIVLQVKDDGGAVSLATHVIKIMPLKPPLQLPRPKINGPYYGFINEKIIFNSTGSYDPDGMIINYTWDFGDGEFSYEKNPVHVYVKSGNYTVILRVTDNDNLSNLTTTKAYIDIKEAEKELPLTFLIIFIIAMIVVILIILLFLPRGYQITVLVEKDTESKVDRLLERSNKNKEKRLTLFTKGNGKRMPAITTAVKKKLSKYGRKF